MVQKDEVQICLGEKESTLLKDNLKKIGYVASSCNGDNVLYFINAIYDPEIEMWLILINGTYRFAVSEKISIFKKINKIIIIEGKSLIPRGSLRCKSITTSWNAWI